MESFFDFIGFAAMTDINNQEWKILFDYLERKQTEFLKYEHKFRSKEYKWPRDPLHTWSRLWEYPYVYYHIKKSQEKQGNRNLRLLDFGSGVTFFPFAVAGLGCHVTCADIDHVILKDIPEAAKWVRHEPGTVDIKLIKNNHIPIESESQDIVYCISVLEHISDFEKVIDEMIRVLKTEGQLIMTVDIDLRGDFDMSIDKFERLQTKLGANFTKKFPERVVHPLNYLTSYSSPYREKNRSMGNLIKQLIKGVLQRKFQRGNLFINLYLGIYATVLQKRARL